VPPPHAGTEPAQRKPADDALVCQLRAAGGAINDALNQVRLTPPTLPPMPGATTAPNQPGPTMAAPIKSVAHIPATSPMNSPPRTMVSC
jgi:hypothetical protein